MHILIQRCVAIAALSVAAVWAWPAAAQNYPDRPIRIIAPFPAGGLADVLARAVGDEISKSLGQPVIVENRAGAGGNVGADAVARAEPDGYTLLMSSAGILSANQFLYATMPFDPEKAFTPVSLVAEMPILLLVHPKVEAKNLDMAILYEDELVPIFFRVPMFRQRLFLVSKESPLKGNGPAKLEQLTKIPLILPGRPDVRRTIIDRAFTAAGLTPNVIAEADTVGSELSLVRMGHAHTILPSGDMSNYAENAFCKPRLIEPPLFLTCSVISSSDFPLTHAGESVRSKMVEFVRDHVTNAKPPGAEWVG